MEIGGVRWFLPRRETSQSWEARSILYTVRYAESNYPLGPILLSHNLALVLALCKKRPNIFYIAFSHASHLCVWFQGWFCLMVQVDTVRIKSSDEESRFFDCDYDPSKSLLHVLAQRLTSTSPSRTSGQDCSSHSPMHQDGGQDDFRSHIHVPIACVQSHAASDSLSTFTGYAAAVSLLSHARDRWLHHRFRNASVSWFPRSFDVL